MAIPFPQLHCHKFSSSLFTVNEISQFNNGLTDEKNARFLSYIRSRWIVAPSHSVINISLNGREDFSQFGQSAYVDKVLSSIPCFVFRR